MPPESLLDDELLGFNDVPGSGGGSTVDPGSYICKLVRFEKMEDGEWGARRRWVFHLADAKSKTAIYNSDGTLHEFKHTTSTKTGRKAKAREFFEALLGRELQDGEVGIALAREAMGKQALALIGENDNHWMEIARMTPLASKASKPAPKPADSEETDTADPFAA